MSSSIIGIPTSRVSGVYIRERMLTQVQYDQLRMLATQTQLSTGHRFEAPSEDPIAAQRIVSLRSMLARNVQAQSNVNTNQSYLNATDSALSSISDLLTEARATALGALGSNATDSQRNAAAQQIGQALAQIVNTANQQFQGRYLFAGSSTQIQPFRATGDGFVEYNGNEARISSYGDVNLLFDTNVTGAEAFGAISQKVQGADLRPALTYDTRLADLHDGAGVTSGSIAISDGHSTSVVDLSNAETIGDVAAMVRAHPPKNRALQVEVTGTGLVIKLEPAFGFDPAQDNLSVDEVGGGVTAYELGIWRKNGVGTAPLVGDALDPALTATTSLSNILGTRAMGFVHVGGANNDFILEANTNGAATTDGVWLNGVTVQFVGDAPAPGQETVDWDPGNAGTPGTITVHFKPGYSTGEKVVQAINQKLGLPFTARLDPTDSLGGGTGTMDLLPVPVVTAGGAGGNFDQTGGLQIASRNNTYAIDLTSATTVEDLLNAINGAGAGMLAQINTGKTGLDVRSRTSGTNFMIGENGGSTASQLGVRSLTGQTALSDLNFGRGVDIHADQPGAPTPAYDFTISVVDSLGNETVAQVDLSGSKTIDDVCAKIEAALGGKIEAQLNALGNGIELINADPAGGTITLTADPACTSAEDLGLVAPDGAGSTSTPPARAEAHVAWGPNSGLYFQANTAGYQGNVQLVFQNNPGIHQGQETAHYDPVGKKLTFQIAPGETTAQDIVAALAADPTASAAFSVTLDPLGSLGTGLVSERSVAMTGGRPESIVGTDTNPLETDSIFNALLRLQHALETSGNAHSQLKAQAEVQRAIGLLDNSVQNMNFVRAELGTREQALDTMKTRLSDENIQLQAAVSDNYDADTAKVVSDFTAQQLAYEASLKAAGLIFRYSLLNYL